MVTLQKILQHTKYVKTFQEFQVKNIMESFGAEPIGFDEVNEVFAALDEGPWTADQHMRLISKLKDMGHIAMRDGETSRTDAVGIVANMESKMKAAKAAAAAKDKYKANLKAKAATRISCAKCQAWVSKRNFARHKSHNCAGA